MSEQVALRPVDAADVTSVVDYSIDILLPSTSIQTSVGTRLHFR